MTRGSLNIYDYAKLAENIAVKVTINDGKGNSFLLIIRQLVSEEVRVNITAMTTFNQAIFGAKETLREFKPKLAISIYHKFNDFYKIPLLIKKINPEYKIKVKNKKGTLMTYAI